MPANATTTPHRLVHDITVADLNGDDIKVLKTGIQQILPQRDHANRIICLLPTTLATTINEAMYLSKARHRAMWYLGMSQLRHDDITQVKGIVVVTLNMGSDIFSSLTGHNNVSKTKWYQDAIPVKIAAFHGFYDSKFLGYKFLTCIFFLYQTRMNRNPCRFLTHCVQDISELKFKLQSYGIPTTDLPLGVDENGSLLLLLENHHRWVEQRRIIDIKRKQQAEQGDAEYIVGPPRKFDVLLGRGSICAQHPGNLRAFHIADMNREHYDTLEKFEKTRFAYTIVNQIQQSGGRFLKKKVVIGETTGKNNKKKTFESFSWIEATENEARDKISHIFRRLRELENIKNKKGVNSTQAASLTEGEAVKKKEELE